MREQGGFGWLLAAVLTGGVAATPQAAPVGDDATAAEYARLLALVERQRAPVKPFTAQLDLEGLPSIGADHAPVTVVEFGSPGCAFCKRHAATTMPALMDHVDSGEVAYVYYDYAVNEDHRPLVEASFCAAEQQAYLAFRDHANAHRGMPSREALARMAQQAGLEADAFDACLEDGRHVDRVGELVSNGRALGIKGTPTFLIGVSQRQTSVLTITKRIDGAQPYEVFANEIAALLDGQ